MFDIPVAIFIFRRTTGLEQIISRLREVEVSKLYIIADGPRNKQEKIETDLCREKLEKLINWKCEVVKNYASNNRGVFSNIGLGAKWVLEHEEWAIFIEDDNLPEKTFFYFCKELLQKYRFEKKVLWICGTNYLGEYETNVSYMFTQHLLPCGWASWSNKFLDYYDGYLEGLNNAEKIKNFKQSYKNKALFRQQLYSIKRTKYLLEQYPQKSSWDYQMLFSIRANQFYGISPNKNQIKNIGVDSLSEHGGNSWNNEMTKRFCGMSSYELSFPLIHPTTIEIDKKYEKKIANIILMPLRDRVKRIAASILKPFLGLNPYDSMAEYIKRKRHDKI